MKLPTFNFEQKLWDDNFIVIGIDEVGRGALSGPVYVGAVAFNPVMTRTERNTIYSLGINDSKQLLINKREQLSEEILRYSLFQKVDFSTVTVINKRGIVVAVQQAVRRILNYYHMNVQKDKKVFLLMDAFKCPHIKNIGLNNQLAIIKGDSQSISIAAASIIAKVARDTEMKKLALNYPEYGWYKNVGYGTEGHRKAIIKYGKTKYHRSLYLRNLCSEFEIKMRQESS